jgi:outer membrane protein assembly factor BamB
VQKRTSVLQRKVPLEPAPHLPARVAPQTRKQGAWIALLVFLGLPVVIMAVVLVMVSGVFAKPSWWTSYPVIADVDGDGVDDVIGFDRNVSRDRMKLTAFSGKTGHVLWHTASLGTYTTAYQSGIYAAPGVVVLWDQTAHVTGFDLKTGVKRWSVSAAEVVKGACSAGNAVVLSTADKRQWSLDLTTGALAANGTGCTPDTHGAFDAMTGAHEKEDAHPKVDGMSVDNVYTRGTGPTIALGSRSPGTAVPMIAALDASGAVLWKADIPGHDPLTANTGTPRSAAISDTLVAVTYERSRATPTLVVFDRTKGTRLYEIDMHKTMMNVLASVTITNASVLVSLWGSLQAFDPKTGATQYTIGD